VEGSLEPAELAATTLGSLRGRPTDLYPSAGPSSGSGHFRWATKAATAKAMFSTILVKRLPLLAALGRPRASVDAALNEKSPEPQNTLIQVVEASLAVGAFLRTRAV